MGKQKKVSKLNPEIGKPKSELHKTLDNAESIEPDNLSKNNSSKPHSFHFSRLHIRLVSTIYFIVAILFFIWVLILSTLKFYFLPNADYYFDKLAKEVKVSTGLQVTADSVHGELSNFNPRIKIVNLQVIGQSDKPPLSAKYFEAQLSWQGLLFGEIKFKKIAVISPKISLERNLQGEIALSGLQNSENTIEPVYEFDYKFLINWLLRQKSIRVVDGELWWRDKYVEINDKNYQEIIIKAEVGVEQIRGRTLVKGKITPPASLIDDISLSAIFDEFDIYKPEDIVGKAELIVNEADLAEVFNFKPEGEKYTGKASFQVWANFDGVENSKIVASTYLKNVNWQQFPLNIDLAEGEIYGQIRAGKLILNTEKLIIKTEAGQAPIPKQIDVSLNKFVELETLDLLIPNINLAKANRLLVKLIPWLPELKILGKIAPQGKLQDSYFSWNRAVEEEKNDKNPNQIVNQPQFEFQSVIAKAGWSAYQKIPSIKGISGEITVTEKGGEINLKSNNVSLNLPEIMYQTAHKLDSLKGRVVWQNLDDDFHLNFENIQFANSDGSAVLQGQFSNINNEPIINIVGNLSDGKGKEVWRYMPKQINYEVVDWLKSAIVGGISPNTVLRLQGNLKHFPFSNKAKHDIKNNTAKGVFQVFVPFKNATLKYQPNWPSIANANGVLLINGSKLDITAYQGTLSGADAKNIVVTIPNLSNPALEVKGKAFGDIANFQDFMKNSPLAEVIPFLQNVKGVGDTSLDLTLKIPFAKIDDFEVHGIVNSVSSAVSFAPETPSFTNVRAKVEFDKQGVVEISGNGKILDIPFVLAKTAQRGKSSIVIKNAPITKMRKYKYLSFPWLEPVSGEVDVTGFMNIHNDGLNISWSANGENLVSQLPKPFKKDIGENWLLQGRVDIGKEKWRLGLLLNDVSQKSVLSFATDWLDGKSKDSVFNASLQISEKGIKSQSVSEGFANAKPPKDGIYYDVVADKVNINEWVKLFSGGGQKSTTLISQSGKISANELEVFGKKANNIKVNFETVNSNEVKGAKQINLKVNSNEVAGKVDFIFGETLQKIIVRLSKLKINLSGDDENKTSLSNKKEELVYTEFPDVDLVINDFEIAGTKFEKLDFLGQLQKDGYKIEKLSLHKNKLKIEGKGSTQANTNRTQIEFDAKTTDLAGFVNKQLGKDIMDDTKMQASGLLDWVGGLADFKLANLFGEMNFVLDDGRFLEIEPGSAKILSLLSLQSIFQRLALDFSDAFSKGFSFKKISGDIKIENEKLKTNNIAIESSVARILMQGEVNFSEGTQTLDLYAIPNVGSGLATGAAFLVNPIVGFIAWFGQKVLGDPIDKLFVQKITVRGSLAEPEVKVKTAKKEAVPENEQPGNLDEELDTLIQQRSDIFRLLNLSDPTLDPLYSKRLEEHVKDFDSRRPTYLNAECR